MKRKPLVVLTYPFFPRIVGQVLRPKARVVVATTERQLKTAIRHADALVCLLSTPVNEALLSRAPRLKAVSNFAVGIDNIDLGACAKYGVRVCNTPDVLTRSTAELALALLLAVARRIPEGEELCRSSRFRGWTPELLLGAELQGRHAVLVGKGRIGRETAKLFQALGISTEFITREDTNRSIESKLRRAEILSIHIPANQENHHWLNARRIAFLPKNAIVLNTARGNLVDEKALIRALQRRRIFGAGLDVYENEPEIPGSLRRLKNVVLLPHLGSATRETREAMARAAMTGVIKILGGKRPWNEVKFSRSIRL